MDPTYGWWTRVSLQRVHLHRSRFDHRDPHPLWLSVSYHPWVGWSNHHQNRGPESLWKLTEVILDT